MSVQKRVGVVASVAGGMVMSEKKQHHRYSAHVRLWGIIVFCVLVLGGIVGGLYLVHSHDQQTKNSAESASKPGQQKLTSATINKDQSIPDQAIALSVAGNGADAQKLLDQALAQTTNKTTQGSLYEDKASVALNVSQNGQALQYARKAESLNPTQNSAQLIGESSEALGDKATALKYYELELQRVQADPQAAGPGDVQDLQAKIKELGGQ